MAGAKVVHIRDYELKSREPDAVHRNISEPATIIILPTVRIERFGGHELESARKESR